MEDLRITLIQSSLHWENRDANLEMFSEKIAEISEETDLIVLPEMFSSGFSMLSKELAEKENGVVWQWMQKQAALKNCVICGSVIFEEGGNYFNMLLWVDANGNVQKYAKRHLFSLAGEQNHYSPGNSKLIVELKGWKILPLICYDLRFPVWSRRTNAENYDLLIYVANWPEKRSYAWKSLLKARSIENQCYLTGLNRVGSDGNGFLYSGDSIVTDFKGQEMSGFKSFTEQTETHVLSTEKLQNFRNTFRFFDDADKFEM